MRRVQAGPGAAGWQEGLRRAVHHYQASLGLSSLHTVCWERTELRQRCGVLSALLSAGPEVCRASVSWPASPGAYGWDVIRELPGVTPLTKVSMWCTWGRGRRESLLGCVLHFLSRSF